ncbi:iron complex outermembrane receptor protein [Nitrospirillum viridazoti]|uniref:Iron complex outermembrane receptor protein n=1 Tax=Nitrospirillum amazonense TaxID=28077 RepID=A0A560I4A2_9PROT|nr:iron complex outermembrane receptor protein [Nitrospirillum amazonense]
MGHRCHLPCRPAATPLAAPLAKPLAAALALLLGTVSVPALAQVAPATAQGGTAPDTGEPLQEIIVTGTSIRGIQAPSSAVSTVTRDDIVATGSTTATELLRSLPQVGNFNSTGSNTGFGQANFVDQPAIHGVGVGNGGGGLTLVLFDGLRLPGAGINQTAPDPSAIPVSALERVEVIADGASSIYGSDAVAGVINFIPRRNYDGAETHLQAGFGNSYDTQNFSQLFGKTWDGGSILLDYEHSGNSELKPSSRSYMSDNAVSKGWGDNRVQNCPVANVTAGGVTYGLTATGALKAGQPNKCEGRLDDDLYPDQHRDQGLISIRQAITDGIELFANEIYSRRVMTTRMSSTSAQASPNNSGFSVTVPGSSPYYVAVPGLGGGDETVTYYPGGSFLNHTTTSTQVANVGADIDLTHGWQGKVVGNFGFERDDVRQNGLNQTLATDLAAAGTLNPTGIGTANSPAVTSALRDYQTRYSGEQFLEEGLFKADGPLFDLPGGTIKAAVGADIRHERFAASNSVGPTNPASWLTASEAAVSSFSSIGERNVKSVFGELSVPIVGEDNAVPGIRAVNLSLATRYDSYSDVGDTTNPKVGLTYTPFDGLTLRGSFGSSFHAPSLADAGTAIDTRAIRFSDFVSFDPNKYSIILAGGNKLKPETADTYSAGFDYKPKELPGLKVSSSYFRIDYYNVITFPTFNPVTQPQNPVYDAYRVYNPTLAQALALTNGFRHDGNFDLSAQLPTAIYDLRRQNFADEFIQGVDFDISYGWDAGRVGAFTAGLAGTWLWQFDQKVKGATSINTLLNTDYAIDFKARASLMWTLDAYTAGVFVNYTNGYTNASTGGLGIQKVDSFTTADLHLAWNVPGQGMMGGIQATLDINNVFDTDPPYYYNTNGISGVDLTAASPLGRVISIGLTKKW